MRESQPRFEAEIDDYRNTISSLHERLEDVEESETSLAEELKTKKGIIDRQAADLMHAHAERDRANDQVVEVTASNTAFAASAEVLANQVATLSAENADVRRMNDVLSTQVTEVKQDRDMLKGQADKVPGLLLEAAVLKEQRDARANEAANFRMMLKDTQEEQALRMGQLREDHADALAAAQKRISELEKLLFGARSFAAVD